MRDLSALKRPWPAAVAAGLLLSGFAMAADERQAAPGPGRSDWIVGELRAFAFVGGRTSGGSSSPARLHQLGWLECAGQALAVEDFPELYKAIGYSWGKAAKGAFLVPDLRGFFLRGWPTANNEEIYRQLMGGDLIKGREDEPPARVLPQGASVTYFIFAGSDVSRLDRAR